MANALRGTALTVHRSHLWVPKKARCISAKFKTKIIRKDNRTICALYKSFTFRYDPVKLHDFTTATGT